MKRQKEKESSTVDIGSESRDIKKGMEKLSRMEKRKFYGGDRTIMYAKLGMIEESDVEKYRKKMGIKKDVDLETVDIEELLENHIKK